MLLREYANAIKKWFAISPLLTNVSALPGETLTWTSDMVSFQSRCIPCLENDTALACYLIDTHRPILIIFVDNNIVLLSTICKHYFSPSYFIFETRYTAWLKRQFLGLHVSPGNMNHVSPWNMEPCFPIKHGTMFNVSPETLVRKGGITNCRLIAHSLLPQQHLCQKIIKIGWSVSKLWCATFVIFWDSVYISTFTYTTKPWHNCVFNCVLRVQFYANNNTANYRQTLSTAELA